MWQCPVKIGLVQKKVNHYWTKWTVGIWAPHLWSMWMSCKLDARTSNSYSFIGPNVHSTSIYIGKHCMMLFLFRIFNFFPVSWWYLI
jgi:hypothetical protein